jgi:hypothetical protein
MPDSGVQRDSPVIVEVSGTDEVQEGEGEAEEGEISTDVVPETVPVVEQGRPENVEVVLQLEKAAEEESPFAASVPVLDMQPIEVQDVTGGDDVVQQSDVKPVVSDVTDVATAVDSGVQEHKGPGELAQPETAPLVATRHSLRVSAAASSAASSAPTTINLADRAKEKAALRRGSPNPQSPAARGRGRATRGAKVCKPFHIQQLEHRSDWYVCVSRLVNEVNNLVN